VSAIADASGTKLESTGTDPEPKNASNPMRRPSNDSAPTKASSPGEIANSSSSAGPTLPGPAPASLPVLLPVSSPVPVSAPAPVSPFGPVDPADLRRWTSRWSRVASSG